MTESVPKRKFIIFECFLVDFHRLKRKKERKKQTKKRNTLKCTSEDRLLVSYEKKVKIKQNNAVPTFHANFYTANTESAGDFIKTNT